MQHAIDVEGVSLTYSDGTTAVSGLNMQVEEGEFYGFLGPNGAGKTTTIKMLVTLLEPTEGSVRVNGHDVAKTPRKVRQSVGYMPQETSIDKELTARENLQYACDAYRVPKADRSQRIGELLELVDLADVADKEASTFSGGMMKRLDAATALVHDPPLVFLDEPTTGLDPKARNRLWEYFKDINERGTTMFLTTQYLEEADYLCERLGVIIDGSIAASGSPSSLKRSVGDEVVTIEFTDEERASTALQPLRQSVDAVDGAFEVSGTRVEFIGPSVREKTMPMLSALDRAGFTIVGMDIRSPTLDDVFLQLTGESIRDLSEDKEDTSGDSI